MSIRVALMTVALTVGCGTASATEARVFLLQECPASGRTSVTKETGALGAALVSKLAGAIVGSAIDSLASALSEEKSVTFVATNRGLGWYSKSAGGTFKTSSKIVCVVGIVADGFDQLDEAETRNRLDAEAKAVKGDIANEAAVQALTDQLATLRSSFGVDRPPRVYFEASFSIPDGDAVFALEPAFLYYPRPIGSNVLLGGDKRDVLIQIEFSEPGESTAFASQQLLFNGAEPGSITTERVNSLKLPWMKPPGTPTTVAEGIGLAVPFNMKFLFAETAKAGRLGKVLGGVLKDQKAAITGAVEEKVKLAVSESERQAARTAANETANTALAAYFKAYDDYKTATDAVKAAAPKSPERTRAEAKQKLAQVILSNAQSIAASAMAAAGAAFTPLDLPT